MPISITTAGRLPGRFRIPDTVGHAE